MAENEKRLDKFQTDLKKIESENKVTQNDSLFVVLAQKPDIWISLNLHVAQLQYGVPPFFQELKDENKQLEIGMREILAQLKEGNEKG